MENFSSANNNANICDIGANSTNNGANIADIGSNNANNTNTSANNANNTNTSANIDINAIIFDIGGVYIITGLIGGDNTTNAIEDGINLPFLH